MSENLLSPCSRIKTPVAESAVSAQNTVSLPGTLPDRPSSAQAATGRTHTVLGHSDPNLTANVYTDVPALGLHAEIAKLPWISETRAYAQPDAQKSGAPWHSLALGGIIAQLVELVEAHQAKAVGHSVALPGTSWHSPLNGCPGWDRTSDQVINSHLLCR